MTVPLSRTPQQTSSVVPTPIGFGFMRTFVRTIPSARRTKYGGPETMSGGRGKMTGEGQKTNRECWPMHGVSERTSREYRILNGECGQPSGVSRIMHGKPKKPNGETYTPNGDPGRMNGENGHVHRECGCMNGEGWAMPGKNGSMRGECGPVCLVARVNGMLLFLMTAWS